MHKARLVDLFTVHIKVCSGIVVIFLFLLLFEFLSCFLELQFVVCDGSKLLICYYCGIII